MGVGPKQLEVLNHLSNAVNEQTGDDLIAHMAPQTQGRILKGLVDRGFIEIDTENKSESGRVTRRTYRITSEGERILKSIQDRKEKRREKARERDRLRRPIKTEPRK